MLRKSLVALVAVLLVGAAFAPQASAQSQAVSMNFGYFWVRSVDGRANTDIAKQELLLAGPQDLLAYDLTRFNAITFGGEWLIGLGEFLEAGVGVNYYNSGNVPSVSLNYVNQDGSEIMQTLKLRNVPITATARFLPLARHAAVEPYVGGGISINIWKYSEVGQFVDSNGGIYSNSFVSSGTKVGPVILFGVRFPFGPYAFGAEYRHQWAEGNLDPAVFGALASTVDLGGGSFLANFTVRFGR